MYRRRIMSHVKSAPGFSALWPSDNTYIEKTQNSPGLIQTDVPWSDDLRVHFGYAFPVDIRLQGYMGLLSGGALPSSAPSYNTDIMNVKNNVDDEETFNVRNYDNQGDSTGLLQIPPLNTPRIIDFNISSYCKHYDINEHLIDNITFLEKDRSHSHGAIVLCGFKFLERNAVTSSPVRMYFVDMYKAGVRIRQLRPATQSGKVGFLCGLTAQFYAADIQNVFTIGEYE